MAIWVTAEKQRKGNDRTSESGAAETEVAAKKSKAASKVTADKPAARLAVRRQEKVETTGKVKATGKGKAAPEAVTKPAENKDVGDKVKKVKLVRDSFTMPEPEYELVAEVKKRCVSNGLAVKKSEVLRAAIASFAKLSDAAIRKALANLEPIKTGRPAKSAK